MKKATTKSERKWGKQVKEGATKRGSKGKVELFRVMIDGSGFSNSMSYDECLQLIEKYKVDSKKYNRLLPSLVIVKQ